MYLSNFVNISVDYFASIFDLENEIETDHRGEYGRQGICRASRVGERTKSHDGD